MYRGTHTYTQTQRMAYDLIVIGGGITGLYGALRFIEEKSKPNTLQSLRILLLEATSKLGGRLQTYYDSINHIQFETGGSRFHSKHKLLNNLIDRYDLEKVSIGKTHKKTCSEDNPVLPITKWVKKPKEVLINQTFGEYIATNYSEEYRRKFQTAFGYDAEFNHLNAYDGMKMFERDFSQKIEYSILKTGFSSLITKITEELESYNVDIHLSEEVIDINTEGTKGAPSSSSYRILTRKNGGKQEYTGNYIFVTIPLYSLCKIPFITNLQDNTWLHAVEPVSLHRIYGQFTKGSHMRMERTTTPLHIRQYIPISTDARVAMVSYSDTSSADYWYKIYKQFGKRGLKKAIEEQLNKLEDQCHGHGHETSRSSQLKLNWVKSYYWKNGVHVWKKGVDSEELSLRALVPIRNSKRFFIMGESFSQHQGWVEGALETVENALKILRP